MKSNILYYIGGVFLTFGVLIAAYFLTNKPQNSNISYEINKITSFDHPKWSPEKKNILIEYSDFQCPACKNFHQVLKQFEATDSPNFEITKKVTFVYRHFPLPQHLNALISASAAEAAGKQGKFWPMADLLFEKQDDWLKSKNINDLFLKYAKELKLDLEKFKKDINSKEIKTKVDNDFTSGEKAGINATPTFFLNGKKLNNFGSFEEFKQLLRSL